MEVVNFDWEAKKAKAGHTYDWPKLMDGQTRQAVEGVDFTCAIDTFVNLLRRRAREAEPKMSVRYKVDKTGDNAVVTFQFLEGANDEAGKA